MTFGEMKQGLYDRLGGTYETVLVERLVNEALQVVAGSGKWRELEKSEAVTLSSTGATVLAAWVRDVLEIDDDQGRPLAEKDRDTWEDLYQSDATAGAARPSAFCVRGMDASGNLLIATWPKTTGNVSGTVRGLRRPTVMTANADVPEVPLELHARVLDEAVARLREWEEGGTSSLAAERAMQGVGQSLGVKGGEMVKDRT